jgi:peptide/nickel transport system substrate-binding protein
MRRYMFVALLILVLISGIIACGSGQKDELIYCSKQQPDTLIPILDQNEEAKYLCELIFDGLVNKTVVKNGQERYEWALAEDNGFIEEDDEDRTRIIISLRKGVYWHDGREFTAEDVIYTLNAINETKIYSPLRSWLKTFIKSFEKVEGDSYKVRLVLVKEMSMSALKELFSPLKILPRWYMYEGEERKLPHNLYINKDDTNQKNSATGKIIDAFKCLPIGTGPYKIKIKKSEDVLLEANKEYYLRKPEITKIRMQVLGSMAKAVKLLDNNPYALLFDVEQEFSDRLSRLPLENQSYLPYSFYAVVFNTKRDPFRNSRFRKGVSAGTDKMGLLSSFSENSINVENGCVNHSIFPTRSMYVQSCPACFREANAFNTQNAQELLSQCSGSEREFRLLICSSTEGARVKRLAGEFVQMMNDIDVNMVVDDLNAARYNAKIKEGDFDAVFMEFAGFDHLYDIRSLFANKNYWAVQDDTLDVLLENFGKTLSWESFPGPEEKIIPGLKDIARDIHNRVEEIVPACFLFTVPRRAYYSDRLMDVTIHPEVGFATIETWKLREQR